MPVTSRNLGNFNIDQSCKKRDVSITFDLSWGHLVGTLHFVPKLPRVSKNDRNFNECREIKLSFPRGIRVKVTMTILKMTVMLIAMPRN